MTATGEQDQAPDGGDRREAPSAGTIRLALPCVRCGYPLRGLGLETACPECGLPVERTVLAVVDPLASGLPRLRKPRVVGNALFGLVVCLAVACFLIAARPAAVRMELVSGSAPGRWLVHLPAWLPVAGAALLGLAVLFVTMLAPPDSADPRDAGVRRGLRWLRLGLVAWAAATTGFGLLDALPPFDLTEQSLFLLMAAGAIVTFLSLRATVRVIGERSRAYRTGRGGRQGFREMAAAAGGVLLGQVMHAGGLQLGVGRLELIGLLVAWVSVLMLLVGLIYMVVNAAWIRHALVSPPPTLRDVLGVPPAPDAPDDQPGSNAAR